MKKTFLSVLVVLSFLGVFAQKSEYQKDVPEAQRKLDALKGTYDIKNTSRNPGVFPSNLAEIIEKNRKDKELNTIQLTDDLVLIIYPKSQIVNAVPATKK